MMIQTDEQRKHTALKSKILITANLKLLTGMHIGGNSDFAPIGAVDSPFIRDLLTHEPIIPGSSLKGKIRTLLAKSRTNSEILKDISSDDAVVARLFGYQSKQSSYPSRLQFFDLFWLSVKCWGIKKIDGFSIYLFLSTCSYINYSFPKSIKPFYTITYSF